MADFTVSVRLRADGSGLVGQLTPSIDSIAKLDKAQAGAAASAKGLEKATSAAAGAAAGAASTTQRVAQNTYNLSTSFAVAAKGAGHLSRDARTAAGAVRGLEGAENRLANALRSNMLATEANVRSLNRLDRETRDATRATRDLDQAAGRTASGGLGSLKAAILGLGLGAAARDITQTAREFRGQEQAFTRIRGSAESAAADIAFLQQTSDRLGVSFRGLTQQSVGLAAGLQRMPDGQQIFRDLTEGVIGLGVAFGRSDYQISNAMRAIEQVANKGRVSLEEITGQLGEAIPDAVGLASRAMGMLPAEFIAAVEAGDVLADEFLPKLAKQLKQELPQGLQSAGADFARFTNELDRTKVAIAEGGLFEGLADGAGALGAEMRALSESGALRELGQNLGTIIRLIAENIDLLPVVIGAWASYRVATLAAAVAQNALNGALLRNPIGLVAAAIGGLAAAMYLGDDATRRLANATDEAHRANEDYNRSVSASRNLTLAEANARLANAAAALQEAVAAREAARAKLAERQQAQRFTRPLSFLGGIPGAAIVGRFNRSRVEPLEAEITKADAEIERLRTSIEGMQLTGQQVIDHVLGEMFGGAAAGARGAADATNLASAAVTELRAKYGGAAEAVREYNAAVAEIKAAKKRGDIDDTEAANLMAGARARLTAAKKAVTDAGREAAAATRQAETEANKLGTALGNISQQFDAEPAFLDRIEAALKRIGEARAKLGTGGTVTLGDTTFSQADLDKLQADVEAARLGPIEAATRAMRDELAVGQLILDGREAEADTLREQLTMLERYGVLTGQIPPQLAQAFAEHQKITAEVLAQEQAIRSAEAARRDSQELEQLRLVLAGREDEAEVLRRVYQEVDNIAELGEGRLDQIRAEVRLTHELNRALDAQELNIRRSVDAAGDLQDSLRDAIRGMLDGDTGGIKDVVKGIGRRFKDALADQISTALFGDMALDVRDALTRQSSPMAKAAGQMSGAAAEHVRAARAVAQAARTLGDGAADAPLAAGAPSTAADLASVIGALGGGSTAGAVAGVGGLFGIITEALGGSKNKGVAQASDEMVNAAKSMENAASTQVEAANVARAETIERARAGDAIAQYNLIGERLGQSLDKALGTKFLGKAGAQLGTVLQSAAIGEQAANFTDLLAKEIGLKTSKLGSQIGGAIGGAIGGPLGAAVGGALGSVVGGLFKKTKKGFANYTINDAGELDIDTSGNSKQRMATGVEAAGAFGDALKQIADTLGGTITAGITGALGMVGKKFSFDPTPGNKADRQTFKTAEEALAAAVKDAVTRGGVAGLSEAVRKALASSSDLNKALQEATKVRDVETFIGGGSLSDSYKQFAEFDRLSKERTALATKYGLDLVRLEKMTGEARANLWREFLGQADGGASVLREFERTAAERLRIAQDFGFDIAEMERVNAEQRVAVFDQTMRDAVGGLMDLRDQLRFGGLFEGDASQRRGALQTEIDRLRPQAEEGVAGAADKLAALLAEQVRTSRESFGTAGAEFLGDRAQAQSIADQIIAQTEAKLRAAQAEAIATGAAADMAPTNALLDENNAQNAEALSVAKRTADEMTLLNSQIATLAGQTLVGRITAAVKLS